MLATERKHLAFHVFGKQFLGAVQTRPEAGLATHSSDGREHDGTGIDRSQCRFAVRLDNKVGAFDTDGGHRGVEPKAVALGFAPGTGDGTHHPFVEPKLDGSERTGITGAAVVFDLQSAGRAHAQSSPVDKAQVHVAARAGFNAVTDTDGGAPVHQTLNAIGGNQPGHTNHQCGFPNHGCTVWRTRCARRAGERKQQYGKRRQTQE